MERMRSNYRGVLSAIGWALVILWGLMQILGVFVALLSIILELLPLPAVATDVIYELFYGAGYLATFMLPVAFLRLFLRRGALPSEPMELSPRVSPYLPLMVFATVALCFASAQLNALLLEVIDYSAFTEEVLLGGNEPTAPHAAVLRFIVISIVPGFCEEFLFRGAILGNLLPYGKGRAILISAILFALMHQNPGQLLYTFVAGVALGVIYVETKSIWNCTVVHLLNNFISVIQETVYSRLGDSAMGNAVLLFMECAIYLLGAISLGVLILRFFHGRKRTPDHVFGTVLPTADGDLFTASGCVGVGRVGIPPSLILFAVLSVIQMVLLLGLAFFSWAVT